MTTIGFIGLGHMGLPMALNCLKNGYGVIGYDLQQEAMQALKKQGGKCAQSLAEAAQHSEVIITMLQTGAQVKAVTAGPDGLFANARADTLYIDCSTIDVESSREVHALAAHHQLAALDAPVSGGVAGAEAGSLTFMVGGEKEIFQRAQPVLKCMGQNIIHAGNAGNGQAAKICNNMILGISMIAVSESFVLAEHLGLDAKKLQEVVHHASGQCWTMDKYVPVADILPNVPANHNYEPGFTAAMMLKDLRLSQHCAAQSKLLLPMANKAQQLYEAFIASGKAEKDFSAIILAIKGDEE